MKHHFSRRVISMLLTLLMVVSLFSAFATTATAEAKIIDLPLIINGGAMVGDDMPNGIYNLPQIEGIEYCDEDCDCGNPEHYCSNRWYNQSDATTATEFVDGEYYVYIITIHPKAGYAFPSDITESSDLIYVTNVAWGQQVNAIVDPDCICVAFRYRYYDADNGVVGDENISAPISIDGTPLREITQPISLGLTDVAGEYTYCDGVACSCSDAYLSDTWFDAFGNVVTEFEEGEEYFYQVTIHFQGEYTLNPNILPEHAINVTGIAWDTVRANFDGSRLYAEFHIENYDPTEGIPARYSADLPCVFDGTNLGGLNTPMGLGLEDTEEYYHCYDGCNDSYWWTSDTWFTSDDEVATEFIDGEQYYYQITLHAQPGYYFNFEHISQNQIPIMVTGIKWDSISWGKHFDGVSASFYMTYDAETGIPFAEIIDPIVIDGSSMAGETAPVTVEVPTAGEGYYYCDDECCEFGNDYPSFIWFNTDDMPVTEFIDGETYYFQVAVHTEVGYEFDVTEDGDVTDYDLIRVTGIDWDYTNSWYDYTTRLLYTEFYLIYDASVGIPATQNVAPPAVEGYVYVGDVGMNDGDYLANGATATQKTKPDGGYAYYNDGVLTLHDFYFDGETINKTGVIESENELIIVLEGENELYQDQFEGDIISMNADITIKGDGKLYYEGDYGIYGYSGRLTIESGIIKGYTNNFAIYTDEPLTINGGKIDIGSDDAALAVNNDFVVNGGDFVARSWNEEYDESMHAVYISNLKVASGMKVFGSEISYPSYSETEVADMLKLNEYDYVRILDCTYEVYVGGVGMANGDYLANNATATQKTKPTGGYAYYKDGVLTLNNYVYNGVGGVHISDYDSVLYSYIELEILLQGENSITQTVSEGEGISVFENITISGDGRLNIYADYGIYAWNGDLNFVGGYIYCESYYYCISCYNKIIIDGTSMELIVTYDDPEYDEEASALWYDSYEGGDIIFGEGVIAEGATEADGTFGTFDKALLDQYDHVKITCPTPEPEYMVGDINGNGKIDARDYLLLKRAYFGTYTLTCAPEAADVNGNGKLDARDYLLLKRAYFGTYTIQQ